jgi:GH25 family lysozyme M1 (1,4-beta-N-acetylmuramidase)
MLWLDIEGRWNRNIDTNIQFIEELIQQINMLGVKFGIYTSKSHWHLIMNNVTKFSLDSPLWYSHYDNDKSFNDFQAFGGWRKPLIKQFISDVKECGIILDRNFS